MMLMGPLLPPFIAGDLVFFEFFYPGYTGFPAAIIPVKPYSLTTSMGLRICPEKRERAKNYFRIRSAIALPAPNAVSSSGASGTYRTSCEPVTVNPAVFNSSATIFTAPPLPPIDPKVKAKRSPVRLKCSPLS